MKMANRIFAGVVLLASLSGIAATTYTEMVNGVEWTYTEANGCASVGGGSYLSPAIPTSTSGAITIPSMLGGKPVTGIGNSAFEGRRRLTSVTIPSSVTNIGSFAFRRCSGLTNIAVSVNNSAYKSVGGLLLNKDGTFLIRGVNGVVAIPDGVISIMAYAFDGCGGLTSVTIPNSVTSIGDNAFTGCSGLTSVTIPDSVTSIGEGAFDGCGGLTSVTIPDSVTSIGDAAFYDCDGLTSVTIPDSVTNIGNAAFYDCSGLTNVLFMGNAPSIGFNPFLDVAPQCSVTVYWGSSGWGVEIPGTWQGLSIDYVRHSVTFDANGGTFGTETANIPHGATIVELPEPTREKAVFLGWFTAVEGGDEVDASFTVTNGIALYAHWGLMCSYTVAGGKATVTGCFALEGRVEVPSVLDGYPVTAIAATAFTNCINITGVTIPDSVTSIGNAAFYGCSGLTSVMIGTGVETIKDNAFYGCSELKSIVIPDSVVSIGRRAFYNCRDLKNMMIGNGVTEIGDYAFYGCVGLTNITVGAYNTAYKSVDGLLLNKGGTILIQGVNGSVTIPDGVTSIGGRAFYGCVTLTDVTIPESVTTIGDYAFSNCRELTNVLFKGDAPVISENPFSPVLRKYNISVYWGSSGWGVDIPGTWQGVSIDYLRHSVTFDANGGTCGTGTVNIPHGAAVGELPVPTREKAVFLGWFTEAERGDEVDASLTVTNGIALYAHWLTEVAAPVIATTEGSTTFRVESCQVSITCDTEGVAIYYTDDGSTPRLNDSYLYTRPITITGTTTFKAVAVIGDVQSQYETVTITQKLLTLEEALDVGEGIAIETGEALPWTPVFDSSAKVGDATARSGAIGNRTNTWLSASVSGAGTMTFWCKVSCEHDEDNTFTWDRLMVYTNDVEIKEWRMDGETDWTQRTLAFAGGENTVRWVYFKDRTGTEGEDCAWVDTVTWMPSGTTVDVGGGKSVTVPGAWIAEHAALVEVAGGDASAALAATAANGRKVWECYALGLDPEDNSATNDFRIVSIRLVDGKPQVEWEPKMNRWTGAELNTKVMGAAELEGPWQEVGGGLGETALPGNFRFFKVEVMLP